MNIPRSSKSNICLFNKPRLQSCQEKILKQSISQFYDLQKLNFLDAKRKSTMMLKKTPNPKSECASTNDDAFKTLLENRRTKRVDVKHVAKTLDSIKGDSVTVTKKTFVDVVRKCTKSVKRAKPEESRMNVLTTLKSMKAHTNSRPLNVSLEKGHIDEIKKNALKNLLDEKFDSTTGRGNKDASTVEDALTTLYQKEMLFEQVLNLLSEDSVDINALLFSAFEKLQSDNYIPPTSSTFMEDGYFVLEDKVKLPTPKWKKEVQLRNELKINLSKINSEE